MKIDIEEIFETIDDFTKEEVTEKDRCKVCGASIGLQDLKMVSSNDFQLTCSKHRHFGRYYNLDQFRNGDFLKDMKRVSNQSFGFIDEYPKIHARLNKTNDAK